MSRRAEAPAPVAATHRVRTACLLMALCFVVYLTNLRPMAAWDSIPARLIPFSLLRHGTLDLNEFRWLRRVSPRPYFLRHVRDRTPPHRGRWLSAYPVALPILVTPIFAPVVWWLDAHHVPKNAVRFRLASVIMERVSAAVIAAISVGLVYLGVAQLTSPGLAIAIALVYGVGTCTWSTGSQALWQHGFAELALAGLSLALLVPDTRRSAVAAGGFAALAVLARPTMIVFALLAFVFVWRERRQRLPAFLVFPALGAALLFAYNRQFPNTLKGGYGNASLVAPKFRRLLGLLVSPNRGLFIYTPAALLAVGGIGRAAPRRHRWLAYLLVGMAGYLLLYSCWRGWLGGYAYGPRFLTDMLPAIALCAVPAVERLWRAPLGRVLLVALALWGIVVQAIGVYCDDGSWNQDQNFEQRVWSWSDLQIVRAARAGWHGTDLAPLLWQEMTDLHPAFLRPLRPRALVGTITTPDALPLRLPAGGIGHLDLQVTNRGRATWPAFTDYGYLECKLAYRWWAGKTLLDVAGGIPFPVNVGPGESIRVHARVYAPPHPGQYELEIDLVQVLDLDKGRSGGTVLRVPVQVE